MWTVFGQIVQGQEGRRKKAAVDDAGQGGMSGKRGTPLKTRSPMTSHVCAISLDDSETKPLHENPHIQFGVTSSIFTLVTATMLEV